MFSDEKIDLEKPYSIVDPYGGAIVNQEIKLNEFICQELYGTLFEEGKRMIGNIEIGEKRKLLLTDAEIFPKSLFDSKAAERYPVYLSQEVYSKMQALIKEAKTAKN